MDQIGRLGIDFYSLIVYFVNFGVIYFFAGKYIVKPLIKNIDTRTKKIQSSLEEANELKKQIEEDQKALKTEKREYSLKLNAQITKIKQELNKEAQEQLEEIARQKEKILSDALNQAEKQKSQIKEELQNDIIETVQNVLMLTIKNKLPKEVIKESVVDSFNLYVKNVKKNN